MTWTGFRRINWKNGATYVSAFWIIFLSGVIVHHDIDVDLMALILPNWITGWFLPLWGDVTFWRRFQLVSIAAIWVAIAILGLKAFIQRRRYQQALERVNLKNSQGQPPTVLSLRQEGAHHLVLRLRSLGVGKDRYIENKDNLESAFAAPIEKIRTGENPQYVEIVLAKRKIPDVCYYRELISQAKKPYSFVIGETASGPITESIQKLRHIIIAGTTGGGKSAFFKQLILGLIHTSRCLQVYLIDLKKGVEVKEFEQLPNVVIAKNEVEAVTLLRLLKEEMDRRFEYMENDRA